MGLLLGIAEKSGRQVKGLNQASGKFGLFIGLSQALAIFPGVSRSGITLTAAMLCGWKRQDAAKFSFLLGIPAITFAGLVELKSAFSTQTDYSGGILPIFVGILSSAIISWFAIAWMLSYLQKKSTFIFIMYRLIFGTSLLIWWWSITRSHEVTMLY